MTLIDNYFDLIGNTPLYNLKNIKKELNLMQKFLQKLNFSTLQEALKIEPHSA